MRGGERKQRGAEGGKGSGADKRRQEGSRCKQARSQVGVEKMEGTTCSPSDVIK